MVRDYVVTCCCFVDPIPDIRLQIRVWQEHFASIFGFEALRRVKGFSPPEMSLPIHPDVCYEYVRTLKECGYEWLMVQEHTIENMDGSGLKRPYAPHRLVAKNSLGEVQEITILIKTKGSDTKLVAQMQPYYEAKTKSREEYCGKSVIPYVLQIADGENGGVMMNEFPDAYKKVFGELGKESVVAMNGSEYLEFIKGMGLDEDNFVAVQPISQYRIWKCVDEFSPGAADRAIDKVKDMDPDFDLDRGSWTNDRSWVEGYGDVLDPIRELSVEFHKRFDDTNADRDDPIYSAKIGKLGLTPSNSYNFCASLRTTRQNCQNWPGKRILKPLVDLNADPPVQCWFMPNHRHPGLLASPLT